MGDIFYVYTYQRLAKKRYSNIMGNDVTYTYGTVGTDRGRPVLVEDGTGRRELSYDALGNVSSEVRIIAIPSSDNVYRFTTGYTYDSWGRMLTMTYPDGISFCHAQSALRGPRDLVPSTLKASNSLGKASSSLWNNRCGRNAAPPGAKEDR
ncbi:MAG: RHS repeat protein [Bacteroidales bacterium]|nr:RHS repeat protein [Bacteroidales bacterium]